MKDAFPIVLKPSRSGAALALAALLLPLSAAARPHHWDKLKPGKDYLADEVVVQILESQDSIRFERAGKNWKDRVDRGSQTAEARELLQLARSLDCRLVKKLGTLPFYEFKIPSGADPTQVCEAFESHPETVKLAEPNGILNAAAYPPYAFPNDPYYQDGSTQWNLTITALDKAWNTPTGAVSALSLGLSSVTVAVLDSGINNTHVDLIGQTLTGYNVLDGTTVTADNDSHGTRVSGVLAASIDNSLGVAGESKAKILPVKMFDTGGTIGSDAATAISWATTSGAKLMVLSLYGSTDWAPMRAACDDAYYNNGIVLVAATGNTGSLVVNYPASYPDVIGVAASTSTDSWASYSSFGTYVSCVAPSGIETTDIGSNTAYVNGSGTSFSSPGVAGLVSILIADGVPFYECVSRIATTCDKIDAVSHPYGVTTTCGGCLGSWNNRLGYGRINFYRAMETLVAPVLNTGSPGVGSVDLSWSVPPLFDAPISGYNIYRSTIAGGPYSKVNAGLITGTAYNDVSGLGGPLYYVIKAVNANMLATRPSNELSAVPTAPSPTITSTFSVSPTYSASPSSTVSPSSTGTPTMTPTDTSTATQTATPTCTSTSTITGTFTDTPSSTATPTLTPTFSLSPTSTKTPTVTPTSTATSTPTPGQPVPTLTPSPVLSGRLSKVIPYPNPYRGTGKVSFAFPPGGAQVQLRLYNLAGDLVASLVPTAAQAQNGQIDWDPGLRLATGIYVLASRIDGKGYFGKLAVIQPSSTGGGLRFPGALGSPTGR